MRIAELRKAAGLTQKMLSKQLGIERSTVAKWEAGETNPRAEKLPDVANALGCTVNELFDHKADQEA